MNLYKKNLQKVLENIQKANTKNEKIHLVGVSKSVTSEVVKQMYDEGLSSFGENKVQVLSSKINDLKNEKISWHFIGRLQSNKINQLIDLNPVLWHSCDSLKKAIEFNKRLESKNKTQNTLLQINSANEDEKQGVSVELACEIYEQISLTCKQIRLQGVMSIGAFSDDEKMIQKSFEKTYKIYEKLKPQGAIYCSMGMSSDYELAIKCGSNMLRIGSVLFH